MSIGLKGLLVKAVMEDEGFREALEDAVAKVTTTDDLPLAEQVNNLVHRHETITALLNRVYALEELVKKDPIEDLIKTVEEQQAVLKPVVKDMELVVVEDEKGGQFLARKREYGWQVHHLYAVTYHFPSEMGRVNVTKYVIAESLEAAVNQGTCGLKLEREECEQVEASATGAQLPLMLRGWSGNQF